MFNFEGKDIPAKEWCSVTEALEWIAFRITPVPSSFTIRPRSNYRVNEFEPNELNQILRDAKSILFSYAATESVRLRGKRALGENCKIIHLYVDPYSDNKNAEYVKIVCDTYGDHEKISNFNIKTAGKGRLEDNGILYNDSNGENFAFIDIEFNFRQLIEMQPPPDYLTLQIGAIEQAAILAMPTDNGITSADMPFTSQEATPQTQSPAYLDPNHPHYSLKLAAAIAAWEALTADPALFKSKTPKAAALKWLTDNAKRLGLIKNDGTINDLGIEELAKIINWKPIGGAPRTRGG
jgi:hypothetical protein